MYDTVKWSMRQAEPEIVQIFRKEIEALNGRSYVASSVSEVAGIIQEIASQSGCSRMVRQQPLTAGIAGEELIDSVLDQHGLQIICLGNSAQPLDDLSKADMAITRGDLIIARTGTVVMTTNRRGERELKVQHPDKGYLILAT